MALKILISWFETLGAGWRLARNDKIEKVFFARPVLSSEKFYQTFFQRQGVSWQVVDGVRRILERELDADLSRIVDSDDFSTNLAFFWDYDSMADVEIVFALEKEFAITLSPEEAANAHTVRDIIELVSSKLSR